MAANPYLDDEDNPRKPLVTIARSPESAGAPIPIASAPIGNPEAPAPVIAAKKPVPIGNPQLDKDQKRLGYLRQSGSGIDQITKPVDEQGNPTGQKVGLGHKILGALARVGDVAASTIAPGAATLIPGTTLHHEALIRGAQGAVAKDEANQATETENALRTSQANEADARAQALLAPPEKSTEEKWSVVPNVAGPGGKILQQSDKGNLRWAQGIEGVEPLKPTPDRVQNPEERYLDDFFKRNPNATMSDAVRAYARDSQRPQDDAGKETARSDKSYQYESGKLDKIGEPVEQLAGRIGRLRETISQNTPQANALVAPELMTVMAGGQGSGLRMNEAEISRVVGGRSNWESLKASINKWKLDPTQARSITPEQNREISMLVDAVFGKLIQKQKVLDAAREKLLDTDDPKDHRRIVMEAHQALTAIDEGAGHQEGGKVLTTAQIEKAAKDNKISVDEARKQAEAQGYTVK